MIIERKNGHLLNQCFHPLLRKLYVSRGITFNEQDSYFKEFHLHGEHVGMEYETLISLNMTFQLEIGITSVVRPIIP